MALQKEVDRRKTEWKEETERREREWQEVLKESEVEAKREKQEQEDQMQSDWDRAAELAAVEAANRLCRSREPGLIAKQARPRAGGEEEIARNVEAW